MISRITSFFFMMILTITSFFGIPLKGYESKKLFNDAEFENGFTVMSQQTENGAGVESGDFIYNENGKNPKWMIAQWTSKTLI